ncbi:hypothetical protein J2Z66_001485 [Paenibacillus eucommiae]|uniref:Uncharacterized protein n=1 Tax=Paenibacillus eucommiae TaxID=1355755 RepID=A0ABS4IQP2_9BACL|nr:hypothetical protein [Paenibacillus eucommiae]
MSILIEIRIAVYYGNPDFLQLRRYLWNKIYNRNDFDYY